MKKVLALILSVLLLVAGLPFAAFAADTAPEVNELDGKFYTVGEILYQNDFESSVNNELPEGWEVGIPPYAWNGGGSVSAKAYHNSNGQKYFSLGMSSTDGFVSSPVINTRNYIFEADITYSSDGKYLGIVNNMTGGVSTSKGAIINRICRVDSTSYNATYSKVKDITGISEQKFDLPSGNPAISETFKVKIISLDGKSYFYYNDELVSSYVNIRQEETTDCIGFYGCNSWFSADNIVITAINLVEDEVVEENVIDKLEETTGFSREDSLLEVDFAKEPSNVVPAGWTFSSSSVGTGSSDTSNRNVLRLNHNTGTSSATYLLDESNFAAVVTVGMDYAQKLSGSLIFRVYDKNGQSAAYWALGLPKRSASQTLKAGKSCVANDTYYYYPAAGDYTFSTDGYTTVQMVIYLYNGTFSAYWPDGTFIYSVPVNANADLSNGCKISLANDWGTAYIHDIAVYETAPYVPPFDSGLVENSGFIADDPYYNMDFATAAAGTTLSGWTFSSSSIGAGSADTANRNVLRLNNDTGYSNARFAVPFKNFAATITVGMDYAKRLNGSLVFGVKNADDVLAATWSIGLPKRSESQTLKAGKSVITKGSGTYDYIYPAAGDYVFSTSGYTTVKMVMYLYNGVFYFFWEDGTLVGSVAANSACDLSKDLHIYLGNDWATAYIHDIKVYEIIPNSFKVNSATLGIDNNKTVVNFGISYDDSLKNVISSNDMEFGAVVTVNDNAVTTDTTINTKGATIWNFEKGTAINDIYNFSKQYVVTNDIADKYINIRLFVKTEEMYSYADAVSYCPAQLADVFYRSTQDSNVKAIIDRTFASSNIFLGKESRKTTFTVFSDFHYVEGMYISSIKDMNTIFDRANASGSSFVLSAGDMCNDIKGSPELINALLNNKYGLTAANVYGNHELEGPNSMEIVTPTLTNAQGVVWGTADGSYDSSIAYYYFEKDGFRIICTDTNYSWDPTNEIWEHNTTWSYGPPAGNTNINALGPVQLEWLQKVLNDAAAKDIPCILMGHASLHGGFGEQSFDASKVMEMCVEANKANPNTVMMLISGHSHDDRIENINGIVCFRVNTTRNGYWKATGTDHYTENDTFMMETYDNDGNFLGYVEKKIGELSGGKNTHFTKEALSATVTIDECGIITIEGMGATWMNGVEPDLSGVSQYIRPQISNYSSFNCEDGHIWDYEVDEFGNFVYDECLNPDCGVAIVGGKETYKVSDFVYDNESYKVNFNYSANSTVKLGFFVADKENANTINYIEGENKAIFTANGSGSAEILLTVDKKGGLGNGVGNELYMYVIEGNASDIEISDITALKLTNANGGSLITNKGVSILTDVAENKTQAMRYYFSYDTTTGSDLVIDGKSYTVKSRGFLFANGDDFAEETVTRESAKNGKVIDMNISKNFANCWKAVQNNDAAQTTNLWFSTYVKGFAPENGSYNNTDRLYVKGYVVVEVDGVEFTLYGQEVNATVSEVAALTK